METHASAASILIFSLLDNPFNFEFSGSTMNGKIRYSPAAIEASTFNFGELSEEIRERLVGEWITFHNFP